MATLELGSAPHQGESGEVDFKPQLNPQSRNTPKQEITHTTSKETVGQLLSGNWIFDRQFVWTPQQGPGTVLEFWPIHPASCNWPNRHVIKMFNAWTGGMKVRVRMMATAFNGGSLRVGFLPPNIKPQQIASIGPQILSTYPSSDIDPKNTAWLEFVMPDQRDVLFHYGQEPNFDDPRSFAGYFVIFVIGRLVTTTADISSLTGIVELAGDFEFLQPNPTFESAATTIDNGPLGNSVFRVDQQDLCDTRACTPTTGLALLDQSVVSLHNGFICALGIGGQRTYKFPNASASVAVSTFGDQIISGSRAFMLPGLMSLDSSSPSTIFMRANHELNTEIPVACENDAVQFTMWEQQDLNTYIMSQTFSIGKQIDPVSFHSFILFPNTDISGAHPNWTQYTPANYGYASRSNPLDFNKWDSVILGDMSMSKRRTDESFVLFFHQEMRAAAIQTTQIGEALASAEGVNYDITWLYQVIDIKNEEPQFFVRLWPDGYFTTTAMTTQTMYLPSDGFSLRYVQTLPSVQPIPAPNSKVVRNIRQLRRPRAI